MLGTIIATVVLVVLAVLFARLSKPPAPTLEVFQGGGSDEIDGSDEPAGRGR